MTDTIMRAWRPTAETVAVVLFDGQTRREAARVARTYCRRGQHLTHVGAVVLPGGTVHTYRIGA